MVEAEMKKLSRGKRGEAGKTFLIIAVLSLLAFVTGADGVAAQDIMTAHHHPDSALSAEQGNSQQRQDWARARLDRSPRHQDRVDVKHGHRTVKSFVVYPASRKKTT